MIFKTTEKEENESYIIPLFLTADTSGAVARQEEETMRGAFLAFLVAL